MISEVQVVGTDGAPHESKRGDNQEVNRPEQDAAYAPADQTPQRQQCLVNRLPSAGRSERDDADRKRNCPDDGRETKMIREVEEKTDPDADSSLEEDRGGVCRRSRLLAARVPRDTF
ncbi:MAG: hypothetical protein U0Q11_15885 [Vicinamibacterales bacterium]